MDKTIIITPASSRIPPPISIPGPRRNLSNYSDNQNIRTSY
jgi:hypothetical protein